MLEPLDIRSLRLRNRMVMAPMWTGKATDDGYVTEELIRHYAERPDSLGLQVVEATAASNKGLALERSLQLDSDDHVPGLEKLVKLAHLRDTLIAIQLYHGGGVAKSRLTGSQPLAPSAVMIPLHGEELPREMTEAESDEVVNGYRLAARRACEAGFDAVEVHGAHYVLLPQFHSPLTNKRNDKYGGSLENRARLSLRIVKGIKKELGADYPVLFRLGVDDMLPGGLPLHEGVRAAKMIAEAGADVIDVSAGIRGHLHPTDKGPGFFVPLAQAVKKAVKVPMVGVGGIKSATDADRIIRSGQADLVAVGRAILAEPMWARNVVKELGRDT